MNNSLLIGVYLIRNQLRKISLCLILGLVIINSKAQTKYWIGFKDKSNPNTDVKPAISSRTIVQRKLMGLDSVHFTDIPVSSNYVNAITTMGIHVEGNSRWLNAVSAYLDPEQVTQLMKFDFIKEIIPVKYFLVPTRKQTGEIYTEGIADLGADEFISRNIDGTGVKIGVIDAGFFEVDKERGTSHLVLSEKIIHSRDYLDSLKPISFSNKITELDDHGTEVLRCLGGYDLTNRLKYGLATGATYYLARTDHGKFENRAEEDKWIMALEWMDSLGVRLVNSSLGYSTGFDLTEENYLAKQMDGKTSKIALAAQIATEEKGMTIVISAGNEGDKADWLVLTTPADAQGVIAVGAVKANVWEKVSHSSIGPEWLSYIKPDVSAFSLKGTSFSAPLVTGFIACLLQLDTTLSGKELKNILLKSSHLYPFGNNYIGFGVPQAKKAIDLIKKNNVGMANVVQSKVSGRKVKIDLNTQDSVDGVIFRKKNTFVVIKQEVFSAKKGKFSYKRLLNEKFTTFQIGEVIMEFEWTN